MIELEKHIKGHESLGAQKCGLGFVSMPEGYALMLNHDESHYYWLRHDGAESEVHWDRWRIYHSAKFNSEAVEAMKQIRNARSF